MDATLEQGIALEVVKLLQDKYGFAVLPRRWVIEHCFGWVARYRRSARGYGQLRETFAGLYYLAFFCLMIPHMNNAINIVQNIETNPLYLT